MIDDKLLDRGFAGFEFEAHGLKGLSEGRAIAAGIGSFAFS
jgi:hypothetical protein